MSKPEGPEEIKIRESKKDCIRRQQCYLNIRMVELLWFRVLAEGRPHISVTSAFGV
jgi:hypothetical protein